MAGGTIAQQKNFHAVSQSISNNLEKLKQGSIEGYRNYGKAIANAARFSKYAKGVVAVGALVDGLTLGNAVINAQRTGNWVPVGGAIGSIIGSAAAGGVGLAVAPVLSGALVAVFGVAAGTVATSAIVVLLAGGLAYLGGKTGELLGIIIANALAWENPLPDIEAFFKDLSLALGAIAPLILDLNGDGIHTTGVDQSTAHFDFTGEGHRTHTGWITTGDGFLVLDRDSNGAIDTGHELFSNFTKLANGTLQATTS